MGEICYNLNQKKTQFQLCRFHYYYSKQFDLPVKIVLMTKGVMTNDSFRHLLHTVYYIPLSVYNI